MKIAITGSHGTGKTTLLDNIDHPNKLPESARGVMKQMGKRPQDMNHEELLEFQRRVYDAQVANEQGDFISDRGVYDNMAYAYFISEQLYNELVKETKEKHKGYDKVYYVPIEFDLFSDGVRFEDTQFQKAVADKIIEILEVFNVQYETLSGTVEERINQMGF